MKCFIKVIRYKDDKFEKVILGNIAELSAKIYVGATGNHENLYIYRVDDKYIFFLCKTALEKEIEIFDNTNTWTPLRNFDGTFYYMLVDDLESYTIYIKKNNGDVVEIANEELIKSKIN